MITLEAVVVNYFGSAVLPVLLQSFVEQDCPDWRLVVVDNSESPDEFDRITGLTRQDERFSAVMTPANLGYFGGARWWLSARPHRADWVAVCNADLYLADRDFVSTLGGMRPDAVVLAPSITAMPSGRAQNPHLVERPSPRHMLVRKLALSHRLSAAAARKYSAWRPHRAAERAASRPADIYAPHGAFILFHRAYFELGGSLAHEPFLYGEEISVAEQVRELHRRVRYEPSLRIVHNENQATGRESEVTFRAQRQAMAYTHRLILDGQKPPRRGA